MNNAGIRGVCNKWFASFLADRSQQVRVGDALSSKRYSSCGVPQGSGLSAESFLIYINDLCEGNLIGSLTAFADDTALSYCAETKTQLTQMITSDVRRLNLWFQINSLEINAKKSKIIVFQLKSKAENTQPLAIPSHTDKCKNLDIDYNCDRIEESESVKYLGVIIDSKLSWAHHIQKLREELRVTCRKLYFIRKLCPKHLLRTL
ncbi:uncharacterized protein LOC120354047 [Nilaparvata lugens]|uniref:uncharacterized protein LOC120354047 n=1 Tax=Nilaparvata lugens TaxID=108931 RepID=UPI00193CE9D0|nr:uncharacterized protein LOC120354047 [Nilaparvata lugens]